MSAGRGKPRGTRASASATIALRIVATVAAAVWRSRVSEWRKVEHEAAFCA